MQFVFLVIELQLWGKFCGDWRLTFFVFVKNFFKDKDAARIITAQKQAVHASNEERRRSRLRRIGREEEDAEREGFPYMRGGH